MDKKYKIGLMWFRRDLRIDDNAALHHALQSCGQVFCLFVFDRGILDALPRADRRVEFLRESLVDLNQQLGDAAKQHGVGGAGLIVRHGDAADCLSAVAG